MGGVASRLSERSRNEVEEAGCIESRDRVAVKFMGVTDRDVSLVVSL
jgi:hypothetical protein